MTTDVTTGTAGLKAVIEDGLPLDRLSLIGLFAKPDGGTALLRTARGEIVEVRAGERKLGLTINAVDNTGLYITDASGNAVVLQLP